MRHHLVRNFDEQVNQELQDDGWNSSLDLIASVRELELPGGLDFDGFWVERVCVTQILLKIELPGFRSGQGRALFC